VRTKDASRYSRHIACSLSHELFNIRAIIMIAPSMIIHSGMPRARLFQVENNQRLSCELSTCDVCGPTKSRSQTESRAHSAKAYGAYAAS